MKVETGNGTRDEEANQLKRRLANRAKWSFVSALLSLLVSACAFAFAAFDGSPGYWRATGTAPFSALIVISLIFSVEALIMGNDGTRCEDKRNRRLAGAGIAIGGVIAAVTLGFLFYLTFVDIPSLGVYMLTMLLVILWLIVNISNLRFNILVEPEASLDEVDFEELDDKLGKRAKWSVVVAVMAVLLLALVSGLATLRVHLSGWFPEIPRSVWNTLIGIFLFCSLSAGLAAALLGTDTTQRPYAYGGCLAWVGMLVGILAFLAGFLALGLVAHSSWVISGVFSLSVVTVFVVEFIKAKRGTARDPKLKEPTETNDA